MGFSCVEQYANHPKTVELFRFNRTLDACTCSELNERFIESKLAELQSIRFPDCLSWLTFARIGELVLFCAGNYADAGEFEACGDLIFNPRRIAIYIKGRQQPVIKPRHGAFSDALESNGLNPAMRDAYFRLIEKPPVISTVIEQLKRSSLFSNRYLQSISDRMRRIADTVGFLSAYHVSNSQQFYGKLRRAPEGERRYIRRRLCNFNLKIFKELGQDIKGLATSGRLKSRFLKPMANESAPARINSPEHHAHYLSFIVSIGYYNIF